MAEIVTLQIPEILAQRVKEIAAFTHWQFEDVLVEFIDRAITELPIESLPNEQVLALCDIQMGTEQQEVFSNLLARKQEGELNEVEVKKLNELMQVYRHDLVRKARALKVAVERGLKSSANLEETNDSEIANT